MVHGRGHAAPLEGADGGGEGGWVEGSRPRTHVAAWLSNESMGGHTPTTYGAQGSFFVGMGGLTPTTY